jgi:hypothetical protein
VPVLVIQRGRLSGEMKLNFVIKQHKFALNLSSMKPMKVPVHKIQSWATFCVVLCEPPFSYMYEGAAVLLNFVLMT